MTDGAIDRYGPAVKAIAGLVGYWRMDDLGTSYADQSGNGRTGTASGSPAQGVVGITGAGSNLATLFDGVDDRVLVAYNAALNPAAFTVLASARMTGGANNRLIVGSTSNHGARGWSIMAQISGMIAGQFGNGSGAILIASTVQIEIGRYYQIAVTNDATTLRLYIDGQLAGSASQTGYTSNTTQGLRIGCGEDGVGDAYRWTGGVDEVAVYNVALSADQIAELALIGAPPAAPRRSTQRRGAVAITAELWLADSQGKKLRRLDSFLSDGSSAKVVHNVDTEPKNQLTVSLSKRANLVPFADWLIPTLTIRWSGGVIEGPRDMGHFMVVPPPVAHTSGDSLESITGMDLTYRLRQATYKRGRNLAAGQPYTTAIAEVLATLGIDPLRVHIPPSSKIIPTRINVKPGGDKLTVINAMLEAIGYYSLTTDLRGHLVSWPYSDIHSVTPAAVYTADDVLSDPVKEDPDLTRFCNVAIVRRIQTGKSTIYAVAINDREESPASTVSLGGGVIDQLGGRVRVEVTRVVDDNDVPDNAAALVIAKKILDEGEAYFQRFSFKTKPTVDLGFHQTIGLELSNPVGEISAGVDRLYRQSWTLGFTASTASVDQVAGRVEMYQ